MSTLDKLKKNELVALVQARDAEIADLRMRVATLTGDVQALKAQNDRLSSSSEKTEPKVLPKRSNLVHEFDPRIPGDFGRASKLARENGGVVRRAEN